MAVFSYLFGLLIACVSYIVYQKYVNIYPSIVRKPEKRYDYIIVGAGTAGCVLAARLSEDPQTKVLLVEAGDQMGYFTKIPLTPTAAQQGPNDWSVRTRPQKYSSFGMWDQTSIIPRGKGLGGSGQINFLLHGFGLPEDFSRWADLGFKGWTSDVMRSYFLRAFGTTESEFDSEYCAVSGECFNSKSPMKLKLIERQNELMQVFKAASGKHKQNILFRKPTATINAGVRHSTLDAYLKPAMKRNNLHVLLNTQAVSESVHFKVSPVITKKKDIDCTNVTFENRTASSLFILQHHRELDNIFANKEIILSAGAIKTPQLLMLSGIGPKRIIQRLKLKLLVENEAVGRNLHDHMNMPMYVSVTKSLTVTLAKVFTFGTIWDYYWNSQGLLSFPPVAGIEYQNSSALILFSMGTASEKLLRDLSNYKPKVFYDTFPFHNKNSKEGFIFLATCVQPRSRGAVTLKYRTISDPPIVDPNYLRNYWDVQCIVKAMRRAERLIATKPFQEIGAKIHWSRPERCLTFWNYTKEEYLDDQKKKKNKHKPSRKAYRPASRGSKPPDAYLECLVREVAVTGHHVSGTCAGGTVVDDKLRVKSVSGLRVVDASVFPSPVSLFPNSALVAVAERAADLIRESA